MKEVKRLPVNRFCLHNETFQAFACYLGSSSAFDPKIISIAISRAARDDKKKLPHCRDRCTICRHTHPPGTTCCCFFPRKSHSQPKKDSLDEKFLLFHVSLLLLSYVERQQQHECVSETRFESKKMFGL